MNPNLIGSAFLHNIINFGNPVGNSNISHTRLVTPSARNPTAPVSPDLLVLIVCHSVSHLHSDHYQTSEASSVTSSWSHYRRRKIAHTGMKTKRYPYIGS